MVPCQEFLINVYSIKLSLSKNKNRNVFPITKNTCCPMQLKSMYIGKLNNDLNFSTITNIDVEVNTYDVINT